MIHKQTDPGDIHYGKWVVPGGGFSPEKGDGTLLDCAKREVAEELGIILPISDIEERGIVHFQNTGRLKPNGREFSFDYDCTIFSASTYQAPDTTRCENGHYGDGEKDEMKEWPYKDMPRGHPLIHSCDGHILTALESGSSAPGRTPRFEMTIRHAGHRLSEVNIKWK